MKKIFLVFAALMLVFVSIHAQEKTLRQINRDFIKQRTFAFDVDLSKATYSGLSLDKFKEFMTYKGLGTPEYIDIALEKYKNAFYVTKKRLSFVRDTENKYPYKINIKVTNITEKAGIVAEAVISYKDSIDFATINLNVDDGRWNTFDVLLAENAEEQLKLLVNSLSCALNVNSDYYVNKDRKVKYIK